MKNVAISARICAEAHALVEDALTRIERALTELDAASADLSAIDGGISIRQATQMLADQVREHCSAVELFRKRGKFKLSAAGIKALIRCETHSADSKQS